MFQRRSQPQTLFGTALRMAELIFHDSVRNIRKGHRHALIGLLMNMLQTLLFVGIFYVMFTVLGMRTLAVRGDFLLYVMSGVFLYLTHVQSVGAVAGASGSAAGVVFLIKKSRPLPSFLDSIHHSPGNLNIRSCRWRRRRSLQER